MTFLPLDHRIFGNGYGMATPFFDGHFYWLDGELYHWSGWAGCQLASYQWTHPKAGEARKLSGVNFKPFHSERRWGRVRVSWKAQGVPSELDAQNRYLRALKAHLAGSLTFPFDHAAQAIEARRAETGTGSVHESAVRQDAPTPSQDTKHD